MVAGGQGHGLEPVVVEGVARVLAHRVLEFRQDAVLERLDGVGGSARLLRHGRVSSDSGQLLLEVESAAFCMSSDFCPPPAHRLSGTLNSQGNAPFRTCERPPQPRSPHAYRRPALPARQPGQWQRPGRCLSCAHPLLQCRSAGSGDGELLRIPGDVRRRHRLVLQQREQGNAQQPEAAGRALQSRQPRPLRRGADPGIPGQSQVHR
ncbi:hypothetical protein D9M68_827780 [compost metagenome]